MHRSGVSTTAKILAVVVVVIIVAGGGYYYEAFLAKPAQVTLTVYGSVDTADMQTLINDFQGNHSGVTVNYVELIPPTALTRLSSELAGNKSTADVVFETNSVINVMAAKGFLASYNSSQRSNYPSSYYDPSGYWSAAILLPVVFSYNTQAVSTAQLPTLLGLDNSSWNGKVTMLDPTLGSTGTQYLLSMEPLLGNQTWTSWLKNLETDTSPSPTSSTTAIVQNVASGQFDIGVFSYLHDVIRLRSQGANVNWFLPAMSNGSSIPLYTALESVAIVKNTPHLTAAQQFVDFVLSKGGQETIGNSAVRIPAMPGLTTPYSIESLAPGAKVILFPSAQVSAEASAWGSTFKQWGY